MTLCLDGGKNKEIYGTQMDITAPFMVKNNYNVIKL